MLSSSFINSISNLMMSSSALPHDGGWNDLGAVHPNTRNVHRTKRSRPQFNRVDHHFRLGSRNPPAMHNWRQVGYCRFTYNFFFFFLFCYCNILFIDRLPIVQGGTFSFLVPTFAILSLPEWKCPSPEAIGNMTYEDKTELWQLRMREIQGAIIVASLFQILMGMFGIRLSIDSKFIIPIHSWSAAC